MLRSFSILGDIVASTPGPKRVLLASALTPEPCFGLPDMHLGAVYPSPVDRPPRGYIFHPRCASATEHCSPIVPNPVTIASGQVECHLHGKDGARSRAVL